MQQGKIVLTCGHEDFRKPNGWTLYQEDWSAEIEGNGKLMYSVSYCTQCFCANVLRDTEHVWTNYEEAREAIFGQT